MKAYNPEHVHNRVINQQAERWQREGLLRDEQLAAVRQSYPVPFRDSNVFAEMGAFIFTGIAVGGAYALVLLFINSIVDNTTGFGIFNGLVSVALIILTSTLIRQYNFYRNGPDNALVVLAASFLLTALNTILPNSTALWLRCLLAVPVLLLFAAYYGDTIVAFMALIAFYAGLFSGLLNFSWGREALPFVLMGVSLGLSVSVGRFRKRLTNPSYYSDAISMTAWGALVVLAAAGNYFVVRETNGLLIDVPLGQVRPAMAPPVALSPLFWLLTFLIPGAYTYLGFQRKDRMLIVLGFLGVAAAFSTVRYYHPLLPLSIYLSLVGVLMIGGAVLAIRYLRQPRFGFSDVPDEDSPRQFFLNAETLSLLSATGTTINRQPDMRFGEGDFGGGGAGKSY